MVLIQSLWMHGGGLGPCWAKRRLAGRGPIAYFVFMVLEQPIRVLCAVRITDPALLERRAILIRPASHAVSELLRHVVS